MYHQGETMRLQIESIDIREVQSGTKTYVAEGFSLRYPCLFTIFSKRNLKGAF
jgi:hypothetical protein